MERPLTIVKSWFSPTSARRNRCALETTDYAFPRNLDAPCVARGPARRGPDKPQSRRWRGHRLGPGTAAGERLAPRRRLPARGDRGDLAPRPARAGAGGGALRDART